MFLLSVQACVRGRRCVCVCVEIALLCSESSSDCPNKPEQTGRRQCRDVTHSSNPWRLSAWRRAGGGHGDRKQRACAPPRSPAQCKRWEQTSCRGTSFIYHVKPASEEITAPHTCKLPLSLAWSINFQKRAREKEKRALSRCDSSWMPSDTVFPPLSSKFL